MSVNYSGTLGGIPAHIGGMFVLTKQYQFVKSKFPVPDTTRNFWIVAFELPPLVVERIGRLSVRERSFLRRSGGENLGDLVKFESQRVDDRFRVYAGAEVDQVALRELFGPQLVVQLQDAKVSWDQVGAKLLVYTDDRALTTSRLAAFHGAAAAIARAYWTEQR